MRSLGLFAILSAVVVSHECAAQSAVQTTTKTVCAGSAMPAGWVWAASQTLPHCGLRINNAWALHKLPTAGQITVCAGQAIPAGWVKTGTLAGVACQPPSASPLPPQSHGAWVLTALDALAGGATATVCAGQVLPSGWHVVGLATSATNCLATGAAAQDLAAANNVAHISKDRSTCQLRVDTSTVAPGAPYRVSLSSLQVPADASVSWSGTKNGTPDLADARSGTAIDTYLGHNGPGQQGTYTRQVEIRSAQGQLLCSSNLVAFTLAPAGSGRP